MTAGIFRVPQPTNEPVYPYAPGDPARVALEAELARQSGEVVEIPCVIGGERVYTGNIVEVTAPFDHSLLLARVHFAGPAEIAAAVDAAEAARPAWAALPWDQRAAVLLKAADLITGPRRFEVNVATMLGQAKTCHQSEIDAVCEIADFWRFNPLYAQNIYADQPPLNSAGCWNRLDHRPLDGFVFAITPFNFTSIALNLPTSPALMGNTVVWKPTVVSSVACWGLFRALEDAGLPPGVINMVNASGSKIGPIVFDRPEFAGLHFTGSTGAFQHMWRTIGQNIANYGTYPRIVGETGGKDFILAHPSADAEALAVAIVRGGFEYQGQKCSAASRIYVPSNLWDEVRDRAVAFMGEMKMGDVRDFSNFVSAVIDEPAFRGHSEYLDVARQTATILAGGEADDSKGWFIQPTLVQVDDPKHRLMEEEIFGPIVTTYVYDEADWEDALDLVDSTSPYALTGAVFARDRHAIDQSLGALRHAAGNFYINDKPTGAVVGQQPFGGGRASGTNDKAGSPLNLLRWVSPRTIKENFVPPHDWRYPFMG
ncbi:MAG: L-glutamate gamma-semialdehyde dehydrogenase [Deltaproteobacteria bacterium]|nr:L-glutamate gamma-semialdehyde dehydrogenase [Deltaproteobacteria bacterium]